MVINPIVGVYIPIIRIPVIKGGRSPIPNATSLDPGSYVIVDCRRNLAKDLARMCSERLKDGSLPISEEST